jgi:hypothetical protein
MIDVPSSSVSWTENAPVRTPSVEESRKNYTVDSERRVGKGPRPYAAAMKSFVRPMNRTGWIPNTSGMPKRVLGS